MYWRHVIESRGGTAKEGGCSTVVRWRTFTTRAVVTVQLEGSDGDGGEVSAFLYIQDATVNKRKDSEHFATGDLVGPIPSNH